MWLKRALKREKDSANNLTLLRYSKKLGIRLLLRYQYQAKSGVIIVLQLNTILGFQYRPSTRPWLQTFKTRLKNESRVGIPIHQNFGRKMLE